MFKILMIDDEKTYHQLYEEIITGEMQVQIEFATDGLNAKLKSGIGTCASC